MSAPDTNTQKQAEKHRGPLTGMLMMVIWAAVLLVGLLIYLSVRGGTPEGADAQIDTRTGTVETTGGGGEGAPATDDASQAEGTAAEDPAAVTVPAETVVAPDSGAGNAADTDPGESQTAQPLDPVDGEGPGDAPAGEAEPSTD